MTLHVLGFRGLNWTVQAKEAKAYQPRALELLKSCATTVRLMEELCKPAEWEASPDPPIFGVLEMQTEVEQSAYMVLHESRFSSPLESVPLVQMLIEYMGLKVALAPRPPQPTTAELAALHCAPHAHFP
jgi:hypothetical protein